MSGWPHTPAALSSAQGALSVRWMEDYMGRRASFRRDGIEKRLCPAVGN